MSAFAAGVVTGALLGGSFWAFITGTRGRLVGDDDTNEFGRCDYYGREEREDVS